MFTRGVVLAEDIGITYRQIHHWAKRGYILPEGGELPQKLQALNFNSTEVRIVRLMARLVAFGFKPDAAATLAREHVTTTARTYETTTFDIEDVGSISIHG